MIKKQNTNHLKSQTQCRNGFSLVELMVVITVIGILSAILIPKMATFKGRAIQVEAKNNLAAAYLAALAYQANHGEYPDLPNGSIPSDRINQIGFSTGGSVGMGGKTTSYIFSMVSTRTGGFAILARSDNVLQSSISQDQGGSSVFNRDYDFWRINTYKWLCQPYDAVTRKPATVAADDKATTATAGTDCPQSFPTGSTAWRVELKPADCIDHTTDCG